MSDPSPRPQPSWIAVTSLVLGIMTALGGASSIVYERATKDAAIAQLDRRQTLIESQGSTPTQIQANRITQLETQVATLKAETKTEMTMLAAKVAAQGERLGEINGKIDTLLERTKPGGRVAFGQ